jgi:hypothetical protein
MKHCWSFFLLFLSCFSLRNYLSSAVSENAQLQVSRGSAHSPPSSEIQSEEQLNTIIRTFQKLPPVEAARLNIDLSSEKIELGSAKAAELLQAWKLRQDELKEAMKSLMKPAEFMGNLTKQLKEKSLFYHENPAQGEEEIQQLLIDLESLVADIDNARDFHTIGAWPVLVSFLDRSFSLAIRTKAAWAIGTAVKNSYDYQLWALENVQLEASRNASCLSLLLEMFKESSLLVNSSNNAEQPNEIQQQTEFQKRTFYALSSVVRGNVDIQEHISKNSNDLFFTSLQRFLSLNSSSLIRTDAQVMRKVFSLILDLLEEREYIRYQLKLDIIHQADKVSHFVENVQNTSMNSEEDVVVLIKPDASISALPGSSSSPSETSRKVDESVAQLALLGDYFFEPKKASPMFASFLHFAVHSVERLKSFHLKNFETSLQTNEKNQWIATHDLLENIFGIFKSYFFQLSHSSTSLLEESWLHVFADYRNLLLSMIADIEREFSSSEKYEELVAKALEVRNAIRSFPDVTAMTS